LTESIRSMDHPVSPDGLRMAASLLHLADRVRYRNGPTKTGPILRRVWGQHEPSGLVDRELNWAFPKFVGFSAAQSRARAADTVTPWTLSVRQSCMREAGRCGRSVRSSAFLGSAVSQQLHRAGVTMRRSGPPAHPRGLRGRSWSCMTKAPRGLR
jgi:hypothetical protein